MSGLKHVIVKSAAVVTCALAALALGWLPAAQASSSLARLHAPNACKTFTTTSADALFGLAKGTHLTEKLAHQGTGRNETYECTVTHGTEKLTADTGTFSGGYGGPLKCYKRPKLGAYGTVCVSTVTSFKVSLALFERHKIFFSDDLNKTLKHEGKALYTFALAQSRAYKG